MYKSQDSVHKPQPFRRKRRAEAVSNRGPSTYQPNALLLGQTGSQGYQLVLGVYWAIQAGLLTSLTFARHRLSPLSAFTSGAYFLHNGMR